VLDRATGEFLAGKPFVKVNWMDGFDEKGRPIRIPTPDAPLKPGMSPTNRQPSSYSPSTGLFYVAATTSSGAPELSEGMATNLDGTWADRVKKFLWAPCELRRLAT
jgi:hypothetical protein